MAGKYWLVKCELDECSFDELNKRPKSTGYWRGVRNYQARNFIRDSMEEGDLAFFYHSNCDEPGSPESRRSREPATPTPANSTTSTATTTKNPPKMSRAGFPST